MAISQEAIDDLVAAAYAAGRQAGREELLAGDLDGAGLSRPRRDRARMARQRAAQELTDLTMESAPVNLQAPAIAGTIAETESITITPGIWAGYPAPVLTYTLLSDSVEVEGLEGVSAAMIEAHELTSGQAATSISVLEIATNSADSDSEESNALVAA